MGRIPLKVSFQGLILDGTTFESLTLPLGAVVSLGVEGFEVFSNNDSVLSIAPDLTITATEVGECKIQLQVDGRIEDVLLVSVIAEAAVLEGSATVRKRV
jgi:hypothetical protein